MSPIHGSSAWSHPIFSASLTDKGILDVLVTPLVSLIGDAGTVDGLGIELTPSPLVDPPGAFPSPHRISLDTYSSGIFDDPSVIPISYIFKGNVTLRKPRKPAKGRVPAASSDGSPLDGPLSVNPQITSLFEKGLPRGLSPHTSHTDRALRMVAVPKDVHR